MITRLFDLTPVPGTDLVAPSDCPDCAGSGLTAAAGLCHCPLDPAEADARLAEQRDGDPS